MFRMLNIILIRRFLKSLTASKTEKTQRADLQQTHNTFVVSITQPVALFEEQWERNPVIESC